jgi:hypothetical protein
MTSGTSRSGRAVSSAICVAASVPPKAPAHVVAPIIAVMKTLLYPLKSVTGYLFQYGIAEVLNTFELTCMKDIVCRSPLLGAGERHN